ncbi:hypothetical protein PROAA_20049 [Candidatus Propionivibrio aalborgensis]|uniref:Uncharacterized protein n=1 Tax=Candidatus Propionivibrio aalborgensis TaxID=1860101 RepID=A0A1A8XP26_9RHOO|nr:hypothetical protein PROAA_20049 [Candidatus Propionivibrio aalborgensis]
MKHTLLSELVVYLFQSLGAAFLTVRFPIPRTSALGRIRL